MNYREEIVKVISDFEIDYNISEYYQYNKFPIKEWKILMKQCVSKHFQSINQTADGLNICKFFESLGYVVEDGGLSFSLAAHSLASIIPLTLFGSEKLKEKYLNKIVSGELICANAITEKEAGSDISAMSSTAQKMQDGSYLINAHKTLISNIEDADLIFIYVMTDVSKGTLGGISAFVVEKSDFQLGQLFPKMGLRTCTLGELSINELPINKKQMLNLSGAGFSILNTSMNWERVGMSSLHIGVMQRLFDKLLAYIKARKQNGISLANHQTVKHKIAEIKTKIYLCKLITEDASRQLNQRGAIDEIASMCKLFVSESYVEVCQSILQIYGGVGYLEVIEVERCLRDAYGSRIYSGTNEIQKNIIVGWNGL